MEVFIKYVLLGFGIKTKAKGDIEVFSYMSNIYTSRTSLWVVKNLCSILPKGFDNKLANKRAIRIFKKDILCEEKRIIRNTSENKKLAAAMDVPQRGCMAKFHCPDVIREWPSRTASNTS